VPKRLLKRCAPDSVGEFRVAARQRFQEGLVLAASDRHTAAIYLWGYAAEMTLKSAYFAAIGFSETQPITIADLRGAAASAPSMGVVWPGPNRFHDLRAWAELLVAFRTATPGLAYPVPGFDKEIVRRSRHVHLLWSEILRYHKNIAYGYEMNRVKAEANWLLAHSLDL
jgi:hypothetical protein